MFFTENVGTIKALVCKTSLTVQKHFERNLQGNDKNYPDHYLVCTGGDIQ